MNEIEKERAFRIAFEQGAAKFNQGRYAEAIADFTKAIELNPSNGAMYHNRATAKFELKDYYGAMSDYAKAVQLDPKNAYFYEGRGNLNREMKNYYGAIADYEKAIELEPSLNTAHYSLCRVYALLGQKENALRHLQKALETGYRNFERLESNADLSSIRALPEFAKLMSEFRAKSA